MSKKLNTERMLRAGFQLEQYEDGKFWVLSREAGGEADRIAEVCRRVIEDMEPGSVKEDIVLQCGSDYQDPSFYMDGFLWPLERRDFAWLAAWLAKRRKAEERAERRARRRKP